MPAASSTSRANRPPLAAAAPSPHHDPYRPRVRHELRPYRRGGEVTDTPAQHGNLPADPVRGDDPRHEARHEAKGRRYAVHPLRQPRRTEADRTQDSDSDTSIHAHTNRGNKLKRRARTIREGRLDTTGDSAYRKPANHAGYTRNVISTNPPLYDEDGDLYSPAESDTEHNAAPLEDNAFGEVQLETLLRPLTSPAELADHPSMSLAYKSKALTELTKQAEEMVRREKAKLWKAKRLLRRFLGDTEWVPCGAFETEQDEMMLVGNEGGAEELGTGSAPASVFNGEVPEIREDAADGLGKHAPANGHSMEGVEVADMAAQAAAAESVQQQGEQDGDSHALHETGPNGVVTAPQESASADLTMKGTEQKNAAEMTLAHPTLTDLRNSHDPEGANSEEASTSGRDTNAPSHSMTTRARARSPAQSRTPSPSPSDSDTIPPVHPWYLIPPTSLPSRSMNLPQREADETRQLLLLYVQRQEHAVRLLSTLYSGLQRADRLRREVFRAAKADAHVGEMSDGEDWYDVDDWGLTRAGGELKLGKDGTWGLEKGKDEVDEVGAMGGGEEEGRRGGRGRRRAVKI